MTPTISPFSPAVRRAPVPSRVHAPSQPRAQASVRPQHGARTRAGSATPTRRASVDARSTIDPLGCYTDAGGRMREVIAGHGFGGSVLIVDRDALTLGDRRLVAHLGADEPATNATLVCARYLEDTRRGRCRRVTSHDLTHDPYASHDEAEPLPAGGSRSTDLPDRRGRDVYRLELVPAGSIRELRWHRRPWRRGGRVPRPVSLREVIGAVEGYEPACELTLGALARHHGDAEVSVAVLRAELRRLRVSPIVLNRKLRETVLAAIEVHELSMSEIALRCGRVKRDSKGNTSGETSWLARRLGLVPESGADRPTPWVHSDVLALIARSGLGISPREVELG